MPHRDKVKKLGRTAEHKKAMLNNLVAALFERNLVITTTAKAKEARKIAEKMITIAKSNDEVNAKRKIAKGIHSRKVVQRLFNEIVPLYKNRKSGYTRVVAIGNRKGDGSSVSILELVEKPASEKEKE